MTKRISFTLVTLTAALALSGCWNWGTIGYIEPGKAVPGGAKMSGKDCSAAVTSTWIDEVLNKVYQSQSGTIALKNVEITLEQRSFDMCLIVEGEPVRAGR